MGTMQAAYTDFSYLGEITESIVRKEALIGVSMTGMMDTPDIAFDPDVLMRGADIVKQVNMQISQIIGINQAARTTCVKPAGSTSCILNTSSGIHPQHAKRYFRRVQANKLEETLQFFKKHNPLAVTESVWSSNKTDSVVTFLCKAKPDSLLKEDVSAIDLLKRVKLVQKYWVTQGRNQHLCVKPWLNHNVSNTITIKPDEWDNVAEYIYNNRYSFAGISMLSSSGDMEYQQAPFQAVHDHETICKLYGAGALFSSGLIIHAHNAFGGSLYNACSTFLGTGEKLDMPTFDTDDINNSFVTHNIIYKKIIWIAQAKKFTNRHFFGDKLKMTHCLKSVDAWHTWCELKRSYKDVPWVKFTENNDNTKHTDTVACSGNSCDVVRF
jgi:ribonucleoside-triphosphate reductase